MRMLKIAFEDALDIEEKFEDIPESMSLSHDEKDELIDLFGYSVQNEKDIYSSQRGDSVDLGDISIGYDEIVDVWDNIDFEMSAKTWAFTSPLKSSFYKCIFEVLQDKTLTELLFDEYRALSLMFMTWRHEGVGIWDGSWDGSGVTKEQIELIRKNMSSASPLAQAFENSMYEDINQAISKYLSENMI